MSDSANALLSLSNRSHSKASPAVKLGDTPVLLDDSERSAMRHRDIPEEDGVAYVDGKGGFKKVYGLPDGRAVAVLNLDALKLNSEKEAQQWAATWERAIKEEQTLSEKVRHAGLTAQNIDIQNLTIDGHDLPVMVMPRFETLAENGIQVRDVKNPASSSGSSMVFGTPENFESADRLKFAMQGLVDDAALTMLNGFSFGGDSCNIAICDTEKTPKHDRKSPGLFDERHQKIRFYYFDFASKNGPRNDKGLPLIDANGNPDKAQIADYADHYVTRAYDALMQAVIGDEVDHILELKKSYPSQHSYDNQFNLWRVPDANFKAIKEQLVADLTSKTIEGIEQMPLEERLQKFRRPENAPPLELPGNGQAEKIETAPAAEAKKGIA